MSLLEQIFQFGRVAKRACYCNAETHVTETEENDDPCETQPPHLFELTLEYTWAELSRATDGFAEAHVLGEGHSGTVYRGDLEEGLKVAVKVLSAPMGGGFMHEVRLLSRCHHPNVVTLLGYAIDAESDLMKGPIGLEAESALSARRALVYELLPGGNAFSRLRSTTTPYLWNERLQTGIDASRGLAHLHKFRPELFHRDIKSANILFGEDGTAKIADFGLACASRYRTESFSAVAVASGTPGYSAPEYSRTSVVTEAAEVYSMGMVLIELLTSRSPAKVGPNGALMFLLADIRPEVEGARDRLLDMVDSRGKWPWTTAASLAVFALLCIHEQPDRRPRFLEAVAVLQNLFLQAASTSEEDSRTSSPKKADGAKSAPEDLLTPEVTTPPPTVGAVQAGAQEASESTPGAALQGLAAAAAQSGPVKWLRRLGTPDVRGAGAGTDALDGPWVHKSNPGIVEVIKGDTIHGQDGTLTRIVARDKEMVTIEFDGNTFRATLVGDELFWDDGDIWVRRGRRQEGGSGGSGGAGSPAAGPASPDARFGMRGFELATPPMPGTAAAAAAAVAAAAATAPAAPTTTAAEEEAEVSILQDYLANASVSSPLLAEQRLAAAAEAEGSKFREEIPPLGTMHDIGGGTLGARALRVPKLEGLAGHQEKENKGEKEKSKKVSAAEGLLGAERYNRLHHISELS